MNNYILSCCSTADLTKEHFEQRNIHFVCFHYIIDGETYDDDLGNSMPFDVFYQRMTDGADTKTSQVNVDEYINYFRPFLENGQDILHLTLSSGISGTYNSACIAQNMLQEEFPDRKIYIADSLCAASGYGLFMDAAADQRDEGMNIDELYQWVLDHRLLLNHQVLSTELTFYIRGGRISKASGIIGNMLNICPIIYVNREGKLIVGDKVRTKRKAMKELVAKMEAAAVNGASYSGKCYLSHSACAEDAKTIAQLIEEKFPNLHGKVEINNIGTVIGSHTGPGTVAIFFWGNERTE